MTSGAEGRPAGFVSRLLAFVIDVVVISISLAGTAWFFTRVGSFLRISAPHPLEPYRPWIEGIAAFLFAAAYFVAFWTGFGRTPGKAIMGVKVVTSSGGRVGFWRSLGRFGGYLISALPFYAGFAWIIVDDHRSAWHDHLAGTRVIYSRRRLSDVRLDLGISTHPNGQSTEDTTTQTQRQAGR